MSVEEFVAKWSASAGAETANSQSFLNELCDVIGVPHADATQADESQNAYVFEKAIEIPNGDGTVSQGRADLYKAGCFVLESKQGVEAEEKAEALAESTKRKKLRQGHAKRGTNAWRRVMEKAKGQARRYATSAPKDHGWPVFLIVCDVGYCFDLYADFSRSGRVYEMFPDPRSYRITLEDLKRPEIRDLLKTVWTEPGSLDPAKRSAAVTRELATKLAKLAKSLEADSHEPQTVAGFLMRCLFTMFAEDVGLLGFENDKPKPVFTDLLHSLREDGENFGHMLESLWADMDTGGFSAALRQKVRQFNGAFFKERFTLPLNEDQIALLIEAAEADWADVEPAIFGTLIERALDPVERHKLGAHYTPRAYVERLVEPTIMEPLRKDWAAVEAAASEEESQGNTKVAERLVREFHHELCETKVLDPACGSGNFLYVSLELMKRLEGEVIDTLRNLGGEAPLETIDPENFLGIEINPRAAAIAELVLWIGYLKWHFRTRGYEAINDPILHDYKTIECRDAVLAYDEKRIKLGDDGQPITHWDGRTTKTHPVTGEQVPDETARVPEYEYVNPRKAEWPEADFIIGNPPFIGDKAMKTAIGETYSKTLRNVYEDLPAGIDFVMYWWSKAANRVRASLAKQFGLIATNSLRQNFNRRTIQKQQASDPPLSILFAVPDHPWVDESGSAAVRISMSVGGRGEVDGRLVTIEKECSDPLDTVAEMSMRRGPILADLRVGPNIAAAGRLAGNDGIACPGVKLFGQGFVIDQSEAASLIDLNGECRHFIKPYAIARELARGRSERYVVDLRGVSLDDAKESVPELVNLILARVKPERDQNNRKSYRERWWLFGEPRLTFNKALENLPRYIATPETSKHRFFVFSESKTVSEGTIVNIALDDGRSFGVLSSRIHEVWSLSSGSRLGVGNDPRYNTTRCFFPFPFPDCSDDNSSRVASLGEQLDAHRKSQQELHPDLTMTGMYNVLEKLRSGEPLTKKEQTIHEQGLVSVLKEIHDDLDAAVFEAYGWPADLDDEEILQRLVDLNAERAAEEAQGKIRWLRPEFQDPDYEAVKETQGALVDTASPVDAGAASARKTVAKIEKRAWPKGLPDRMRELRQVIETAGGPMASDDVAACFKRAPKKTVAELLETLEAVGQARRLGDGRYAA